MAVDAAWRQLQPWVGRMLIRRTNGLHVVGTYLVVNRAGWFLTAAHNIYMHLFDEISFDSYSLVDGSDKGFVGGDVLVGQLDDYQPTGDPPKFAAPSFDVLGQEILTAGFVESNGPLADAELREGIVRGVSFQPPTVRDGTFLVSNSGVEQGQSGGPVFTREGHVIGIQSRSTEAGSDQPERASFAADISTIVKLFRQEGIDYQTA